MSHGVTRGEQVESQKYRGFLKKVLHQREEKIQRKNEDDLAER